MVGFRCPNTGFHLVDAQPVRTFRIQKNPYPALSAPKRDLALAQVNWNRYDTLGTTVYFAETLETAFEETLAPFRRIIGDSDPLTKDAAALGMTVEKYYELIESSWPENSFMHTGTIPRIWRDNRTIYTIQLSGNGWWVDIEHPDTMAALTNSLASELKALGVKQLDTAVLRSADRRLTTTIGSFIRASLIKRGARPLGVIFPSRHGGSLNWAAWMWGTDEGYPDLDDYLMIDSASIQHNTPELVRVAGRHGLKVF